MKKLCFLLVASSALYVLPASAQTLFAVNQGNATVSVIDTTQGKQVATLDEGVKGVHAHEIAVSNDGKTVYLPVYGSTGVGHAGIDGTEMLIFDVPSGKISSHIDFGKGVRPHDPVLDDKRHLLYVTTELNQSVTIIDPASDKIVGTVPTGAEESHMLAISHDGKRGYTANVGPGSVSVLDLVNRKTIKVIAVSGSVQRISISHDDKHVFTADQKKPQMVVIDTATNAISGNIELPATGYGAAATPDGKWLLVAIPSKNQVSVIDLAAMKVMKNIDVSKNPQEIIVDPMGKTAYVSCSSRAGMVDAIGTSSWTVRTSIAAGPGVDGLAWAK